MGNKNKPQRFEGFWWSEREPHFPKPVSSDVAFEGKEAVIVALEKLEKDIYLHKDRAGTCVYFKGFSICRCCGAENGDMEFSYKNWKWPVGLSHYVKVHNIKPSDDFLKDVLHIG
jgi:hypothetical protein